MTKILLRGGMSPYENKKTFDVMRFDRIGTNSGNMLYLNGVYKSLQTKNSELFVDHYSVERTKFDYHKKANEINESYDKFVMPLANSFRGEFSTTLRNLTNIVKHLKIPCIVTGIGLQVDEYKRDDKYSFDEIVKEFISEILDRSSCIGVRGQITADYLSRLGFKNHVSVIGCPSMYLSGINLKFPNKVNLSQTSKISFNFHDTAQTEILKLFNECLNNYQNIYMLSQKTKDLRTIYLGIDGNRNKNLLYQLRTSSKLFLDNRIRFFVNIPSWINFLSSCDFSVGTCLHGTVAAVQAGIPALLLVTDSRTRELAEYHNIPHLYPNDLVGKNILDIYEQTDFSSVIKGHKERFDNYINFLKMNDLDVAQSFEPDKNEYDIRMNSISDLVKPVECFTGISHEELVERMNLYHGHLKRKIDNLISENLSLKDTEIKLKEFVNKIAWWIPVKKWRDNFRAKFR